MDSLKKEQPLVIVSDFQSVRLNENLTHILANACTDVYLFVLHSPLKSTLNSFLPLKVIVGRFNRIIDAGDNIKNIIPVRLTRDFDFTYSIINSLQSFGITGCDILIDGKYADGPYLKSAYKDFTIKYTHEYFCYDNRVSGDEEDYIRGLYDAVDNRYPAVVPCVDVVVVDTTKHLLLLARKHEETKWRFVGGHVDTTDNSYEAAALRELAEETAGSIVPKSIREIGSFRVDDWRYKMEPKDSIMSSVYLVAADYKKSKRGYLKLVKTGPTWADYVTMESWMAGYAEAKDELVPVFRNGELLADYSLSDLRRNAELTQYDLDIIEIDTLEEAM